MKKIVFVCFILMMGFCDSFAQSMKITANGFIDANDVSKKYIVLNLPNISKERLFIETIKYINANYPRPEEITNVLENEQIVITGHDWVKVGLGILDGGGDVDAQYCYKYDLQFRDGKIRLEPIFDCIKYGSSTIVSLIGKKSFGSPTSGLFNEKGKVISGREVEIVDQQINSFIYSLEKKITSITSENW
ncbi:hypothetical protein [Sphingobacterium faecium]|uniref:hypothetical protein n=1 Tax=Sphingobacterium faecium TaxID=34087 RepID=UPI00320B1053